MTETRNSSSTVTAPAREPELVMTHLFDAPRALVYAAWTEKEHLQRWQGAPEGLAVTFNEVDLRPGGAFRVCMRSPDGVEHWLTGEYREVVPRERLVFTHAWLDAARKPGKETLVTITFADSGAKTELTLRQTGFASAGSRDGHSEGWASTFRRLAGHLAEVRANPSHQSRSNV